MPKESSRRGNHPGSLTFSKRKNQALRRTRRKQGRPEGSFRDTAIHSK